MLRNRLLRSLLTFAGGLLVTIIGGVILLWVQNSTAPPSVEAVGRNLLEALRDHPVAAPIALACFALLLIAGTWQVERLLQWHALKRACYFAGYGAKLRYRHVVFNRDLQHRPFVALTRPLLEPARLSINSATSATESNAETYLTSLLDKTPAQNSIAGFLIEGRPLLGKTRFVVELLRTHRPQSMVIAPRPNEALPHTLPNEALRAPSIDIFLDDIERHERHISTIISWREQVSRRYDNRKPLFIWATVKSGAEADTLTQTPAFAELVRDLDHWLIGPLNTEAAQAVATATGVPLPGTGIETTFSWLEGRLFEDIRRRFAALSEADRTVLGVAALLDDRGIHVTHNRWRNVVKSLHGQDSVAFGEALQRLENAGFLQAKVADPSYLEHVVHGFYCDASRDPQLESALRETRDYAAFSLWGVKLARSAITIKQGSDSSSATQAATAHLKSSIELAGEADPKARSTSTHTIVIGNYWLGELLMRSGRHREATEFFSAGERVVEQSDTPAMHDAATSCAIQLGHAWSSLKEYDEAGRAFRRAVDYAKQLDTDRGSALRHALAAEATNALAHLHERANDDATALALSEQVDSYVDLQSDEDSELRKRVLTEAAEAAVLRGGAYARALDLDKAMVAWRRGAELGERAATPEALETAARCYVNIGLGSKSSARSEQVQALEHAIRIATPLGTDNARGYATWAHEQLGGFGEETSKDEAERHYIKAMEYADQGADPAGLLAASSAATNLAQIYSDTGRIEEARRLFAKSLEYAERSALPRGCIEASIALRGLATLDPDVNSAQATYERAYERGIASGHADGYAAAARASLALGLRLHKAERATASAAAWIRVTEMPPERTDFRVEECKANAHSNLAHTLRDAHDLANALVNYEQAIKCALASNQPSAPTLLAKIHNNRGCVLKDLGRLTDARAAFEAALDAARENNSPETRVFAAMTHANLGELASQQSEKDDAVRHYNIALELAANCTDTQSQRVIAGVTESLTRLLAAPSETR